MPSEKRARQRALRNQKLAVQQRHEKRSRTTRRSITVAVVVAIVIGLVALLSSGGTKKPTASATTTTTVKATTTTTTTTTEPDAIAPVCPPATAAGAAKRVIAFTEAPPMCIAANSVFDATVVTDVGTFVIRLTTATSPAAVNNFIFLARYHFYNGIIFHRAIPGFMIQGGDPTGTGTGGPGYSFTGNTPPSSCTAKGDCYATGDVAMANSTGPSSDSSQFFIIVPGGAAQLADSYTDFGHVISGMNVVEKIAQDGDAADNGTPPKVTHHMISVTIQQLAA